MALVLASSNLCSVSLVAVGTWISLSPTRTTVGAPGAPSTVSELADETASARLAMSQALVKSTSRASGLPWKEQEAMLVVSVTLEVSWARARSGLAAWVSALNSGK